VVVVLAVVVIEFSCLCFGGLRVFHVFVVVVVVVVVMVVVAVVVVVVVVL
jgi:hypothetical protein